MGAVPKRTGGGCQQPSWVSGLPRRTREPMRPPVRSAADRSALGRRGDEARLALASALRRPIGAAAPIIRAMVAWYRRIGDLM
jgi:hypothetical protein